MLKILVGCFIVFSMCTGSQAEQAMRIMIESYQPPILGKDSTYSVEKYDTTTIWIGALRARNDETRSPYRFITLNDSSVLYLLQPKFEVYKVFARAGDSSRDTALTPEQDMEMGLGQLRKVEVWSINPTADTSTIRGVHCHRFDFRMTSEFGEHISDVWISDNREQQISAFHLAHHHLSFHLDGHESIESALQKVYGYPMLKVSRGNVRRTEAIIAIDTVAVDSNFFEIPVGYEEYK